MSAEPKFADIYNALWRTLLELRDRGANLQDVHAAVELLRSDIRIDYSMLRCEKEREVARRADPDFFRIEVTKIKEEQGKVEAIRFARKEKGWGLKDAKEYVDKL